MREELRFILMPRSNRCCLFMMGKISMRCCLLGLVVWLLFARMGKLFVIVYLLNMRHGRGIVLPLLIQV